MFNFYFFQLLNRGLVKLLMILQAKKFLADLEIPLLITGETKCNFENINAHSYFYFIFILSSAKQRSCLTADVFTEGLTKELNIKNL